jgi:hypothetical protein
VRISEPTQTQIRCQDLRSAHPDSQEKTVDRRLFDFVSPFIVLLAVLGYFLFAAFVIYIQQHRFKGFALIGTLTMVYALEAFVVYTMLYGKKINPLETNMDSVRTIGLGVKANQERMGAAPTRSGPRR